MYLSPLALLLLYFLVQEWIRDERRATLAAVRGETPAPWDPPPWVLKVLDWLVPPTPSTRCAFESPGTGKTHYDDYRRSYQSRDTEGLRFHLLPWEPTTEAGKAYRTRQIAYRQEHGYRLDI